MGNEMQPTLRRHRSPALALGLTTLLSAFVFAPPVRGSTVLTSSFLGACAVLCFWAALLWIKRSRASYDIEVRPPLKSHVVQGVVQLVIYSYWGWYWRHVYAEAPLILAQIVFLYNLDLLLSWSRGRAWRLGLAPLPIVLSTNLFLWFRDDWFYLQFFMIATCALGKEYLRWNREGKNTHIFNPSALGLGLFSIVLIATGTTTHYTWGVEIASTLGFPPYIYVVIFAVGLVVQYLFAVTLMTLSAVATLVLLNLVYTGATGAYQFVDTNIPIAVFLGLHLLVTDPATSPRTNSGRVIFGSLYGLGSFLFYGVLRDLGAPEFYDKLLTVPLLNLSVQAVDRLARTGPFSRLDRWQGRLSPRPLNLVHMGCWIALFMTLLGSGFVQAPHPGSSLAFWKQASAQGKPRADENRLKLLQSQAEQGSAKAFNQLGTIYLEGELVERDEPMATTFFARAYELGNGRGRANLVAQFLTVENARPGGLVSRALAELERDSEREPSGRDSFLVGRAYETGRGRPRDGQRALEFYQRACAKGNPDACQAVTRMSAPAALGSK